MSELIYQLESAKRQLQNMDMPNAADCVDAAIIRIAELERHLERLKEELVFASSWKVRAEQAEQRIAQLSSITATAQKWHDLAVSLGFDGVAEAIGSVHDITKERDDLRQRIAESQRQKPVLWIESDPSAANESPVGALFSTVYSTAIRKEKPSSTKNPVWELYAAPIVPPDVEEEVKAEREACAKICEHLIEPNEAEGEWPDGYDTGCEECAEAIRARSGK